MSLKVCEALDGSTLFSKSLQEITGREGRQMEAMRSVPVEQIIRHSISESANDCYEPAIDPPCFHQTHVIHGRVAGGKFSPGACSAWSD